MPSGSLTCHHYDPPGDLFEVELSLGLLVLGGVAALLPNVCLLCWFLVVKRRLQHVGQHLLVVDRRR